MSPLETRFLETLRKHNVRATTARRTVFRTLQATRGPLSMQEIVASTKETDRASIYRTLALFERLHIVDVTLAGWKKRFELVAPFKSHHHHIHCEHCGEVTSIASPTLEKLIKSISEQKGFHLHQHTLELSGCCDACKQLGKDIPYLK